MKTFTIDHENDITVFATPEEAAVATATPFDSFTNEQELTALIADWPEPKLVSLWNGLPGVRPAKKLKNGYTIAGRIWERVQRLGVPDDSDHRRPTREPKRKAKGRACKDTKARSTKKSTPSPNASKRPPAKAKENDAPREGTKLALVIAMLRRKNGATLIEIIEKTGWQKHSVRGFMAGTLKRAGFTVASFKSDSGERTYRLDK